MPSLNRSLLRRDGYLILRNVIPVCPNYGVGLGRVPRTRRG